MRFGWLAAAAAMVTAGQAGAVVLEKRLSFTATNFLDPSAPLQTVTGSFWLTINTEESVSNVFVTDSRINGPWRYPIVFDYNRFGDGLVIGADGAADAFSARTNDFVLAIGDASRLSHPSGNVFVYQLGGVIYQAATVTVNDMSVPEPTTWAMMVAGMAAIGLGMRRRPSEKFRRRMPA